MGSRSPPVCVIFDIDGTLVDSIGWDDELFIAAVRDVLGDVSIRAGWGAYPHVTDAAIVREICVDNGLVASGPEFALIRERFGERVAAHLRNSARCAPLAGAMAYYDKLRASPEFAIGIATGGWGHTARMKLSSAGFDIDCAAFASSDDADQRVRIMSACRSQMPPSDVTVYVGDGEWDRRASAELGWEFVGIGERLKGKCVNWARNFAGADPLGFLR